MLQPCVLTDLNILLYSTRQYIQSILRLGYGKVNSMLNLSGGQVGYLETEQFLDDEQLDLSSDCMTANARRHRACGQWDCECPCHSPEDYENEG